MTKSDYKIAIIGSGFIGMNMAIQLKKAGITDFIMLEKSDTVGGVWRDNEYPGAACDIPSHLYSLKTDPNPNWPEQYSGGKEIYEYLKGVALKYQLKEHTKFHAAATSAFYDEDKKNWSIGINGDETITANILIPAMGPLSVQAYPNIPGREKFKGYTTHTSLWDKTVDLKGKTVAVIGTGASSVQLVPELAKEVKQLHLFQRTASWVMPKRDGAYSEKRQQLFKKFPLLMRIEREKIFWSQELFFSLFNNPGGFISKQATKIALSYLKHKIKDPELRKKLTPDFTIGCKRILFSNKFLPALAQENVEVIADAIQSIDEEGLTTKDGKYYKVDAIIYGTGFHPGDVASLDIKTKSGKNIMDVWKGVPKAYKGIMTHNAPNLFFLLGPNTGLGHNSVIHMGESQADYIIKCIQYMDAKKLDSIEVKKEAEDNYMKMVYAALDKTVWLKGGCVSWYNNEQKINFTLWPKSCTNYRKEVSKINTVDFV